MAGAPTRTPPGLRAEASPGREGHLQPEHISHIYLLGLECQVFPEHGQGCSAMSTESTAYFGTFIASFYKVVTNVHRTLSETAMFSMVYQGYSHVSHGSMVSQYGPTVHSVAVQGDRGSFTLELDEFSVLNL